MMYYLGITSDIGKTGMGVQITSDTKDISGFLRLQMRDSMQNYSFLFLC